MADPLCIAMCDEKQLTAIIAMCDTSHVAMMEPVMKNTVQVAIRFPNDVKEWLKNQAHLNGSSQNSEVIRAIRERMERQEAPTA